MGGSGAGSFEALFPIYRDSDEVDSFAIPTAAATIAIEMGQPFLWTCVIVFLIGAWTLFRRALLRGRDYVYSSAGAGCIIALLISLFANDRHFRVDRIADDQRRVRVGLCSKQKCQQQRFGSARGGAVRILNRTNDGPRQRLFDES
jgi:hypothetical protein